MSRSYKKPWVKDPANRYMKKIHARAFRSRCNQISKVYTKHWFRWDVEGTYLDPVYPSKHEITNQYDICDYIFFVPKRRISSFVDDIKKGYERVAPYWEDETKRHLKACRK